MLLGLKTPWKVEKVDVDSMKKNVDVYIAHEKGSKLLCPVCRKECMVYDHLSERVWRDLDSIEFMTLIHATPPRISCPEHGVREAVMPWTEKRSRFTLRFETMSIRMLQNIDTYNFTEIMHLSWQQAWNIIERAVKRGRERKKGHPSMIGIDEKSYKKGHRYITLVYDMTNNSVDYIAYERKKKSLDEYYETLSEEELANIEAVSMDMWDPFMSSTMEHVPDAESKMVFDRFHVMRHVNEAVDKTRKEENGKLVKDGIMDLNGTRYIWLYSSENLPERYRERYNELRKADLLTGKAYSMKENIRNLWNLPTPDEGLKYWESWYSWVIHSSVDAMKDVARMMKVHLTSIMNYFIHRITNARAEGINSRIALIEKMAYGYRNKEHLKTAIYFRCGNLQ
ncbi:MAG: ISL3 family transposase, partial [Thermoplasmata archaeon]